MRRSAGLLMFRRRTHGVEVLLVHPGGPFWRNRDAGAWSLPKGEYEDGEEPLAAARREFEEETGIQPGDGPFLALGEIRQPGGKMVTAWALEGDCAPERITSSLFSMEWPPKSGRMQEFPEVDRAGWFPVGAARSHILPGQRGFLDRLLAAIPGEKSAPR